MIRNVVIGAPYVIDPALRKRLFEVVVAVTVGVVGAA
jgi:hypothetical protein